MHFEFLNNITPEIENMVRKGHTKDELKAGVTCDYKLYSLACKNKDTILGILQAYTAYSEIHIDDIYVTPNYRKKGIGKKLINKLEDLFTNKGYNNINLVTSEFQAKDFYIKCGFKLEFSRINKVNPKLTKYFFIKYFENKNQNKGILKSK